MRHATAPLTCACHTEGGCKVGKNLRVVFVIDRSGSVKATGAANWGNQLDYVKDRMPPGTAGRHWVSTGACAVHVAGRLRCRRVSLCWMSLAFKVPLGVVAVVSGRWMSSDARRKANDGQRWTFVGPQ